MGGSMIKRFLLALAFAGLLSPVYASGTIPFSFYPQTDKFGKIAPGCKFYTIKAGTVSTPQNAYQDSALTLPLPNPQTCDDAGRLPQMFLADGQIKVRLTDKNGVNILTADNIQVVGASSGGGGGGTVDPTTIMATGDQKCRYGTGVLSGFIRINGRTIGSATSGATERANADSQPLFEYLWNTDSTLAVSTGRGASANADWVANKTIALPDGRGSAVAMLDDMGNSAAGKFAGVGFISGNGTTLGSRLGIVTQTITQPMLPNITLTVSGAATVASSRSDIWAGSIGNNSLQGGGSAFLLGLVGGTSTQQITSNGTISGTSSSINGGVTQASIPTVQPTILLTCYLKL